ncbi:hypothetical protein [Sphaerisporangium sp. NPDC051011]|uniref:hypothetical protein n=1 Tax=Sphaerisporangium sp. NPDC051011 TaxID=3155792 RepID=UPI0033E36367
MRDAVEEVGAQVTGLTGELEPLDLLDQLLQQELDAGLRGRVADAPVGAEASQRNRAGAYWRSW